MKAFKRNVPTVPTSLPEVIGHELTQVSSVGLQAPKENLQIIFFGNKSEQPFELRPKANAILPVNSIRDVYIVGTSGDKLSIGLF